MTYPTVTNTVLTVSGLPLANAPVNIALSVGGFNTDDNHELNSGVTVYTDATGAWSAQLKPNSLVVPAGTYYVVSEPNGQRWTAIVPNGSGPYPLSTILTATPVNPSFGLPAVTSVVGQTGAITGAQIAADPALTATFVSGRACSTDSSFGLSAPTGVGLEFVIVASALSDIRYNGTSL